MVTVLDSGLFAQFNSIFIFLFVLVVAYAFLSKTKFLGEHKGINFFIGLVLAFLFSSSSLTVGIFEVATPWLVLLGLVLLFMVIAFMFMGVEAKEIPIGTGNNAMNIIIILAVIIIFVFSAGQVIQEQNKELTEEELEARGESFPAKVAETIRHPAVLGLLITMLIGTFAIMMLASAPKGRK